VRELGVPFGNSAFLFREVETPKWELASSQPWVHGVSTMKTILALFFALSTLAPADAYKDEWNLIVKAYQQREITIWQAQDLLLEITEKYHPGNREQVAIIRRQVMDELVRIAKERDQRAYDAEMAAQRMRNREAQWAIEDAADAAISRHHNHGYRFR